MSFGEKLKALRKKIGKTQAQLGDQFGLAESTISLYESNKRSPDKDTVRKIAAFFGVTTDYLLEQPKIDLLDIFEDHADNLMVAGKPLTPEKKVKILQILDEEKTENTCVAERKEATYNPLGENKQQRKKVDLSDMVIAAEAEGYIEMTPISDELRVILERIVGDVIDQRERERNNKT